MSPARVLIYADLRSLAPQPDQRRPARAIELHITGNMERYIGSFDGKKYSEAKTPIAFRYGERPRLVLVNDTMMEHPFHLHGMWMELENGGDALQPRKHSVSVKPAERLTWRSPPTQPADGRCTSTSFCTWSWDVQGRGGIARPGGAS
ncbi:MAG: multicopper oxidase domain-containing protein [Sphingomonas sp.]|uniref:multicopper oxidase domain-containing protein n=1 Tax=Sphingomonas sp. TaxID=28214 RepID=UPI0026395E13|nr:multicopper oxidase domain-containing protein [Sphingomonas sp.]MDK2767986.1 multicopper oxidase domain-containing protein [Sphingomonas sp.]